MTLMLSSEHTSWIETHAKKLGFIESKPLLLKNDPNFKVYQDWLKKDFHKPLDYMARNQAIRENPKLLGEQLHSAIILLHPYPKEFESKWIARYAWGKDYHTTMKQKIHHLAENFKQEHHLHFEQRICVDTAPILERSLAQQAGLGWIAKNGCMIHRDHGSFFMIGCWLTSLNYEASTKPSSFHCGKCTRCIDACPTAAFIKPGLLDASKCLSTITIENKQSIEPHFFPHLNRQIFGCDICQEVCPWNRKQLYSPEREYLPPLDTLLRYSETQFRTYFKKTALERPGWTGLRRNFLIAAAHDQTIADDLFILHTIHDKEIIRKTALDLLKWRKANLN